jgi:hypothetical protein
MVGHATDNEDVALSRQRIETRTRRVPRPQGSASRRPVHLTKRRPTRRRSERFVSSSELRQAAATAPATTWIARLDARALRSFTRSALSELVRSISGASAASAVPFTRRHKRVARCDHDECTSRRRPEIRKKRVRAQRRPGVSVASRWQVSDDGRLVVPAVLRGRVRQAFRGGPPRKPWGGARVQARGSTFWFMRNALSGS